VVAKAALVLAGRASGFRAIALYPAFCRILSHSVVLLYRTPDILHRGCNGFDTGLGLLDEALRLPFCDLSEPFERFRRLSAKLLNHFLPLLSASARLRLE